MRRQVEHAARMQTRFGGESQAVAEIVVAVHAIEKQGETLDDEVTVVRDSGTHVPWMRLVENVAFDAESDIHWLEGHVHAAIFTQWNRRRETISQT